MKTPLLPTLFAALMLTPILTAPAAAQPVAQDTSGAGAFVDKLAESAFSVLKTTKGGQPTAAQRSRFRSLLTKDFAVKSIGDRLIRRWRPTITPAQYSAYSAAFPDYIINTYADRLADYADAELKVTRVAAAPGNVGWQVFTVVTKPGAQPANAVWSVVRTGADFQITNLTVGGVNLALTQAADFDSYVQSHGFDALIAFMKSRQS